MKTGKQSRFGKAAWMMILWMAGACFLTGCSEQTNGVIYLTGVSRLKLDVNADGNVKELRSLNKAGNVLEESVSWKGGQEQDLLNTLVPLLMDENAECVYLDIYSENKSWEDQKLVQLQEAYGADGTDSAAVVVRKVRELDDLEAENLPSEEIEAESLLNETEEEAREMSEEGQETEESSQEAAESESESAEEVPETSETEPEPTEPVTEAPATTAPARTRAARAASRTTAPATEAPTTAAPVTAARTTEAPTTAAPTTAAPTTAAPTTAAPAAEASKTAAPEETKAPQTEPETLPETSAAEETTKSNVYRHTKESEEPYGPGW